MSATTLHRKTVGILQPSYIPWLGYFEQMARADHFVFLDDVQYTHQDWRNRNRIKTKNGPIWLTVPIRRRPLGTPIREIQICERFDWRRRHLESIRQSYGKAPHFRPFFDDFKDALEAEASSLLELDCRLIRLVCRYLDIQTLTSFASSFPRCATDKNGRLIELCKKLGATRFYEGARGRNYIELDRWRRAGIEVVFQDYRHPVYRQRYGSFAPHQSAIDLIMNLGPEAPAALRLSSHVHDRRFPPRPSVDRVAASF